MEFDKEAYKELKEAAKIAGVKFLINSLKTDKHNGFTVAWEYCIPNPKESRMIRAAVSYCAPEDEFKKKKGKYFATERLLCGQYVQLPLGKMPMHKIDSTLNEIFKAI